MKKTTALLAACVLGVGGLALAGPAQAETDCTGTSQTKIISTGARPVSVVVGTTVTRQLTFYSQVEDPCTAAVSSAVQLENSPLSDDMEQVDRIGNVASFRVGYEIDPGDLANTDAGPWQADITAQGTTEGPCLGELPAAARCSADHRRGPRAGPEGRDDRGRRTADQGELGHAQLSRNAARDGHPGGASTARCQLCPARSR